MDKNDHAVPATPILPAKHTVEEVGFNIIYYRLLCAATGIKLTEEKRITPRLEAKFFFEIGLCSNILDNLFGFTPAHVAKCEQVIKMKEDEFAKDVEGFADTVAPKEEPKLIVTDNLGGEFNALARANAALKKKG